MIADRNLYLASDGLTVTEEGDPKSHKLLVAQGHRLDPDAAKRLNVVVLGHGALHQEKAEAEPKGQPPAKPEAKPVPAPKPNP